MKPFVCSLSTLSFIFTCYYFIYIYTHTYIYILLLSYIYLIYLYTYILLLLSYIYLTYLYTYISYIYIYFIWRLSNHWVILLNMKYYVQGIEWQVPLYQIMFLIWAKKKCLLKRYLYWFAPTPSHINKADLRWDLKVKSQCNPPKGHPGLEAFLNKTKKDIFYLIPGREKDYNLTKDEYLAMRSLENDRNVIIKPADKGSSNVVWDKLDYFAKAEKQLSDSNSYKRLNCRRKTSLTSLSEGLKKKTVIMEKEKNYFKLKRLLLLVSYIIYPRYIRGSVTFLDAPLFRIVVRPQKKFRNS